MKKLKKVLIKIFNRFVFHSKVQIQVDVLKAEIQRLRNMQQIVTPQILPIEDLSKSIFDTITENDPEYSHTDLRISKNDLMFMVGIYNSSVEEIIKGYFKTGYVHAKIIEDLLIQFFQNKSNVEVLDFASGHGRISRYFKNFLPESKVTIAEIKLNAVEFQKNIFGYKGILVPHHPSELYSEHKYDFILCSSLFTHLHLDLFKEWLLKLASMLKRGGCLSFSVHLLPQESQSDFRYLETSEENTFPETPNNLSETGVYGSAYVTEKKLLEIINNTLGDQYQVIDKRNWIKNSQELFSIKCI